MKNMITTDQIILIGLLGIVAQALFLLVILHYSREKNKIPKGEKTLSDQDTTDLDIKLWLQERSFWIPRIILVLTSNSILFLGYVQVRLSMFGGIIAIFAILLNILYSIYFIAFAKLLDSLQRRLKSRLPIEYRKRTIKGRWGFVPLIAVFQSIWVVSTFHSFLAWFC